jgi:Zn ribbon nucleic-acid-binding protein
MRQVVMLDDVREVEIWPSKLFDKYLELTEKDIKRYFLKKDLIEISCPACSSKDKKEAFVKYGLTYNECNKCKTLFLSPRPTYEQIKKYYAESKAVDFWYTEIYKHTFKNRSIHQSRPRAMWIANLTEEFIKKPDNFISINTISQDFLEEITHLNLFKKKLLYEPSIHISKSFIKKNGFKIVRNTSTKTIKQK